MFRGYVCRWGEILTRYLKPGRYITGQGKLTTIIHTQPDSDEVFKRDVLLGSSYFSHPPF